MLLQKIVLKWVARSIRHFEWSAAHTSVCRHAIEMARYKCDSFHSARQVLEHWMQQLPIRYKVFHTTNSKLALPKRNGPTKRGSYTVALAIRMYSGRAFRIEHAHNAAFWLNPLAGSRSLRPSQVHWSKKDLPSMLSMALAWVRSSGTTTMRKPAPILSMPSVRCNRTLCWKCGNRMKLIFHYCAIAQRWYHSCIQPETRRSLINWVKSKWTLSVCTNVVCEYTDISVKYMNIMIDNWRLTANVLCTYFHLNGTHGHWHEQQWIAFHVYHEHKYLTHWAQWPI